MQRIDAEVDQGPMVNADRAPPVPERAMPAMSPSVMSPLPTTPVAELPLAERVERALVLLAYFIELDGDVHIPLYERLEAELTELRRREDTRARARRLLAGYGAAPPEPALLPGASAPETER